MQTLSSDFGEHMNGELQNEIEEWERVKTQVLGQRRWAENNSLFRLARAMDVAHEHCEEVLKALKGIQNHDH